MNPVALSDLSDVGSLTTDVRHNAGRLTSAAKEFESILLGQWLKEAESTLGSLPGNEQDDPGGEQIKEFAMQHLATEMTDRGGLGIARMVARALAKQETMHITHPGEEGE